MLYRITISGISPIIQHNGASGLDVESEQNIEKANLAKKKGANRTRVESERIKELECQISLWLDDDGAPTIPAGAIRSCIEASARRLKQGPKVRSGLIVDNIEKFIYDESLGTTANELGKTVQFTVPVVVQQSRLLRTRAKFDKWGLIFTVEVDEEEVDQRDLETWLETAGRKIGIGDWRPQKSGNYGRFEVKSIEAVD